jgi:hypothetical protein
VVGKDHWDGREHDVQARGEASGSTYTRSPTRCNCFRAVAAYATRSCARKRVCDGVSAARALTHLKVIAREPHPDGSFSDARVQDYLVEQLKQQGLEPQVQDGYRQSCGYFPWPLRSGHS